MSISIFDVARNPALLKLDLYCKGIRIPEPTVLEHDGGRDGHPGGDCDAFLDFHAFQVSGVRFQVSGVSQSTLLTLGT